MGTFVYTEMSGKSQMTIANAIGRYSKQLFGFIKSKVSSSEDAEDILQDVWYQFSKSSNIEELESVSGWLYTIARNKVTDLYRKKKPDLLENYSKEKEEGNFSIKEILLLDDSANPELMAFKEMFWDELFKALNELPENQKEVFVLNELEDFKLQEIADKLNTKLKTIISRKGYAVKYLRGKLDFLYQELNN